MQKIPTVFIRDENDRRYVTREPNPACRWVFAGEGTPTWKYDGTCVMFDGEQWWARREVKPGRQAPESYIPISTDPETEKTVGWEPIGQSAFAKYHTEAVAVADSIGISGWPIGTYELVGPKVNGNPEKLDGHRLWAHAAADVLDVPRDYDGLAAFFAGFEGEGIVWHHPDGRYAKLKKRDIREVTA